MSPLLPQAIVATLLVVAVPSLLVWGLRADGVVSSAVLSSVIAALLSIGLCYVGGQCWQRYGGSKDILFGDLMIWGWLQRRRSERRVAKAISLLGLAPNHAGHTPLALSVEQRMSLLNQLAADLEAFDPYTHGHSRRVARYSSLIARRMGLPPREVATIRAAAALHDVGKLYVPKPILHAPDRLTDEQFAVAKRHPSDGARMIRALGGDEVVCSIVLHHHERLDGTGYPSRQGGEEIPLGARIIAVADTFDAITSERPYQSAKPHKVAIDILRAEAGTQLDPAAVRAFSSVYFGRRTLGVFVALCNTGEGLLAGLIARLTAVARVSATAAGVAALGTGALALPLLASSPPPNLALASRSALHQPRAASSARQAVSLTRGGALKGSARAGANRSTFAKHARPSRSNPRPQSSSGQTQSPTTAPGATSSQGTGAPSGPPAGGALPTTHTAVSVGPAGAGATVSTESGSASVRVGTSAGSATIGATSSGPGVNVSATVPPPAVSIP